MAERRAVGGELGLSHPEHEEQVVDRHLGLHGDLDVSGDKHPDVRTRGQHVAAAGDAPHTEPSGGGIDDSVELLVVEVDADLAVLAELDPRHGVPPPAASGSSASSAGAAVTPGCSMPWRFRWRARTLGQR